MVVVCVGGVSVEASLQRVVSRLRNETSAIDREVESKSLPSSKSCSRLPRRRGISKSLVSVQLPELSPLPRIQNGNLSEILISARLSTRLCSLCKEVRSLYRLSSSSADRPAKTCLYLH